LKFMIMGIVSEDSEAGILPGDDYIQAMHDFNAELTRAGVLVAAEGLYPSSKGARIAYTKGEGRVVDGPFTESKELIAGFWIIDVKSKDEAVAWALRIPVPADAEGEGIEIRQVMDGADLGRATEVRADLPLLERALDQMAATIAKIDPARSQAPTPCVEWSIAQLVEHIIEQTGSFATATGGGYSPSEGSWSARFGTASDALRAAWRIPGALEAVRATPMGEITALDSLRQQITELTAHGWDLAKADGQPVELDPELVGVSHGFMAANLKPSMRGGFMGAEQPVPPDATPQERFVAFAGRAPRWEAP
jgi:uncharacterized protein (TIGR03086 family)